uniref:CHD3-type chromatin-remodeling factor PICKLE n=1 Tax=Lygus hesperus TaxID=30085 RepID=A0A0A9X9A9_LYGHE
MANVECSKCRQSIGENEVMVQCISCRVKKHAECAKLSLEEASVKRWRCRDCKKKRLVDPTASTILSSHELKSEELEGTSATKKEKSTAEQKNKPFDIDRLKVQCYEGHLKLKSLERRMKALNDKYDDVLNKNKKLEKELSSYKMKVEDLEQKIRINGVEIWGIQVSKNEDLMDIMERLWEVMDFQMTKHQVDRVWKEKKSEEEFLVGTLLGRMENSVPKTVIHVNFVTNHDKEEFMSAWKLIEQTRGVSVGQLGIAGEGFVKIENSLTPYKQKLFQKALEYANDFHYPRVGVKNGEIYMLKDLDVGPMIFIKSPRDFEKLSDIDKNKN